VLAGTLPSIFDYVYICAFAGHITWWLFPNAGYFPVVVVSAIYMVATLLISLCFHQRHFDQFYKHLFCISNPNATPQQIEKVHVSPVWHSYLVTVSCQVFAGFFFLPFTLAFVVCYQVVVSRSFWMAQTPFFETETKNRSKKKTHNVASGYFEIPMAFDVRECESSRTVE